jgi:hypothetical protein
MSCYFPIRLPRVSLNLEDSQSWCVDHIPFGFRVPPKHADVAPRSPSQRCLKVGTRGTVTSTRAAAPCTASSIPAAGWFLVPWRHFAAEQEIKVEGIEMSQKIVSQARLSLCSLGTCLCYHHSTCWLAGGCVLQFSADGLTTGSRQPNSRPR